MKLATIILFAVAAFIPIFSAIAQDDEDFERGAEEFGRGEEDFGSGEEEFVRGVEELGADDEDVPPEGRTLGAVPAFGLGLLGGHVGSKLIRNVGSFLGFRKPLSPPFLRPPPAAFYPAPYVPAGFPYPSYPAAFPGRSVGGKGLPGRQVHPLGGPYVPAIPLAPAIPLSYYRSNEDDEGQNEEEQNEEDIFENETK